MMDSADLDADYSSIGTPTAGKGKDLCGCRLIYLKGTMMIMHGRLHNLIVLLSRVSTAF